MDVVTAVTMSGDDGSGRGDCGCSDSGDGDRFDVGSGDVLAFIICVYRSTSLRGAFSSSGLFCMVAPRRTGVRDLSCSAFLRLR
jgi:hypothetical protein